MSTQPLETEHMSHSLTHLSINLYPAIIHFQRNVTGAPKKKITCGFDCNKTSSRLILLITSSSTDCANLQHYMACDTSKAA